MEVVPSSWELKESRFVMFFYAATARPVEDMTHKPVKVSPLRRSVGEVALESITSMHVDIDHYERDTYEFRVLDALTKAPGVTLIEL